MLQIFRFSRWNRAYGRVFVSIHLDMHQIVVIVLIHLICATTIWWVPYAILKCYPNWDFADGFALGTMLSMLNMVWRAEFVQIPDDVSKEILRNANKPSGFHFVTTHFGFKEEHRG